MILTVGIGAIMDDLPLTGELTDVKGRAERLDEGIDLIRVLWEGGKRYHGRFYDYEAGELDELTSMGRPLRQRIPIWVVAVWPRPKSMNRALRCEGVVPQYEGAGDDEQPRARPADVPGNRWTGMVAPESTSWRRAKRQPMIRRLPGPWSADWAQAGCTWWLETRWEMPHGAAERMRQVTKRLAAGPPRPG